MENEIKSITKQPVTSSEDSPQKAADQSYHLSVTAKQQTWDVLEIEDCSVISGNPAQVDLLCKPTLYCLKISIMCILEQFHEFHKKFSKLPLGAF